MSKLGSEDKIKNLQFVLITPKLHFTFKWEAFNYPILVIPQLLQMINYTVLHYCIIF